MVESHDEFDDFLGLEARPFARERLIVFCGRSGSGKSTAIARLVERHPAFRDRDRHPVVLDELTRFSELLSIFGLLRRGHTVIAAAHLPRWSFWVFRLLAPIACFRTDRGHAKLARYLERLQISHSPEAIASYERAYGAVYTDIDIMRELAPDESFDRMLRRFSKLNRIEHRPRSRSRL